jgi:hypothetical protein
VRVLKVTHPPTQGADVRMLQKLLGMPVTGRYDQASANAVYRKKLWLGYQTPDHSAGDKLVAYLEGKLAPTPAMMKRAVAYRHKINGSGKQPNRKPTPADKQAAHEAAVRASAVSVMHLLLAQTARVHYPLHDVRTRTIFGIATLAKLEQELMAGRLTIDCSQAVTLIAHVAGAKDPNGGNFRADGYTGTLLHGCKGITLAQARPGDLCVFGPGTGHHVVMVMQPGADPLFFSHGQEKDPIAIRHSVEARFQPSGSRFLRLPI